MDFATIMVHVDTSRRAYHRLQLATKLAGEYSAALIGLLAVRAADPAWAYRVPNGRRYVELYLERQAEARDMVRHAFNGATEELRTPAEWRCADGNPMEAVRREAHLADLLVIGQDDDRDPPAVVAEHFAETVVLECARPVLVIPYAGWFADVGRRVMVAWNGSREAARAIHDALPFLARAEVVHVVSCTTQDKWRGEWLSPPQYPVAWLARHGISAQVHDIPVDGAIGVGEMLLSRAADLEVDLMVLGAYGRGRLREIVLGGVTQTLLQSMTVPTLFSH